MFEQRSFIASHAVHAAASRPTPSRAAAASSTTSDISASAVGAAPVSAEPGTQPRPDPGCERRAFSPDLALCLRSMLDEIDYGMLLVGDQGQLLYINHAAQAELDPQHPLQLNQQRVHTLHSADAEPLADALRGALRGRRKLLLLGEPPARISLSVVPLAGGGTLLVLGKRRMCEQLSVQGFARSVGLTAAEARVLEGLCNGVRPRDIALRQGVAVSTIRTQIGSIRAKTGVASIRELVRQVAVLPPLVGVLKAGQNGQNGAG